MSVPNLPIENNILLTSDKSMTYDAFLIYIENSIKEDQIARTFINSGDLIFDIGANKGVKTALYKALGARVVAVEPLLGVSADLVAELIRFSDDPQINLVSMAVSDKAGIMPFTIQKDAPYFSSLDKQWIDNGKLSHWFSAGHTEVKSVLVTTLDELIEKYGIPRYIKIDTEGHDDSVLQGLTKPIEYISFEVQNGSFDRMDNALERTRQIAGYWERVRQFNYTLDNTGVFAIEWIEDMHLLRNSIIETVTGDHWADVYVRMV